MRLPRKFLKFDFGLHILFGILMATCIVLVPFSEGMSIFGLMYLMPLLIFWQLLSALFLICVYKDKLRIYYLIAIAAYGVLYFMFAFGHPIYDSSAYLSLVFIVWYTVLTYKDATYRTPSFWDLEF